MPARNGTGPQGQGSRTGREMGKCNPSTTRIEQPSNSANDQPLSGGGRRWGTWINNMFRRRRANRINCK